MKHPNLLNLIMNWSLQRLEFSGGGGVEEMHTYDLSLLGMSRGVGSLKKKKTLLWGGIHIFWDYNTINTIKHNKTFFPKRYFTFLSQ